MKNTVVLLNVTLRKFQEKDYSFTKCLVVILGYFMVGLFVHKTFPWECGVCCTWALFLLVVRFYWCFLWPCCFSL